MEILPRRTRQIFLSIALPLITQYGHACYGDRICELEFECSKNIENILGIRVFEKSRTDRFEPWNNVSKFFFEQRLVISWFVANRFIWSTSVDRFFSDLYGIVIGQARASRQPRHVKHKHVGHRWRSKASSPKTTILDEFDFESIAPYRVIYSMN